VIHQILESIINHKIKMNNDLIKINYRQELVGIRTYKTKYIAEITHNGLNDYKVLTSDNYGILRNKVDAYVAKFEEKWNKITHKDAIVKSKEASQKEADKKTREAIFKLQEIENILLQALEIDDAINWEGLNDKSKFDIPNPETNLNKLLGVVSKPVEPIANFKPDKPDKSKFEPEFSFFDNIFKSRKDKKIYTSNALFENLMSNWKTECETIERINQSEFEEYQSMVKKYEKKLEDIKSENLSDISKWEKSKDAFLKNQNIENAKIDKLRTDYNKLDSNAILEYC
jgi:restriction system protein